MKTSSKTRHPGALERRAIEIEGSKRFLRSAQGDATRLFLSDLLAGGVETHVKRFEELGIADVLLPPAPGVERSLFLPLEHERRICAALGVKAASIERFDKDAPEEWRSFGKPEAEAWFLVNFARFYSKMNDNEKMNHKEKKIDREMRLENCSRMAMALGRLLEWWRWRSDGLDRMAAGKKRSEAARPKATAARKEKAANDPPDWWADARERAAELRSKNSKASASSVAQKLAPELGYSERQVREVIKPLWR